MPTVSIQEAKSKLSELIHRLAPSEEIIITEDNQPVARLTLASRSGRQPRPPGFLRGSVLYMAGDFDAPLGDFKDDME